MRITRLRLTDFMRHTDLEIEPAEGLTIIRGPNEAGKSTVQKALELVLFRKADANRDDIRKAYAWGATEPPAVELDFEIEGHSGTLRKRFGGAGSEAELSMAGKSTNDHSLIADQVARITGIPSEAFFRATASVGHAELSDVAGDEPAIQDRLQKAISGSERGTAKAKKKLEAAIHRYRTAGQKNPGLLKVVREEIAMIEGELASGESALGKLEVDRAAWVEASERHEALDAQLKRQEADLAELRRAEALVQKRDTAQNRYDQLKRAAELVDRDDQLRREMPSTLPLQQLRSSVSRAANLELELSELEADLDTEAAVEAEVAADTESQPPSPARWLALAVVFLALSGVSWLVLGGLVGAVGFLLFAVATVIMLVQAVRQATRRRQYGLAMQLASNAAEQRHSADRDHQERFRRGRRELEATLTSLGVADVTSAQALLAQAERQTEELSGIEGELRGLGVAERNPRRLSEARDQAASDADQAQHALAAMGSVAEDPAAARMAAQKAVDRTTPARDEARSQADQAQGRVDANPVDAEVVAGLSERLAAAREQEAELQRRVLMYQGTLQAIENAETATLKTAARYLEERMGPAIASVTDGRYDEIEVDEKNLAFKVRAPETGEMVEAEQLSQGTADQLFLAARLGLVRLVTMDRRPPLILDDPFVTFDKARGERAVRLVKSFAAEQGFQVLYLTCTDRFDALADKLIVLDGPSGERVLATPRAKPSAEPDDGSSSAPAPPAVETPQPTLQFGPDSRSNPDAQAPRRTTDDDHIGTDPDTGIADPFRLGH